MINDNNTSHLEISWHKYIPLYDMLELWTNKNDLT